MTRSINLSRTPVVGLQGLVEQLLAVVFQQALRHPDPGFPLVMPLLQLRHAQARYMPV